jgi:hypothetical protein
MLLKKITLAALAVTFITGGAAVANAESGAGVAGTGSGFTSSALQNDWASSHGDVVVSPRGSSAHTSYGYAPKRISHSRTKHVHANANANAGMKHSN